MRVRYSTKSQLTTQYTVKNTTIKYREIYIVKNVAASSVATDVHVGLRQFGPANMWKNASGHTLIKTAYV